MPDPDILKMHNLSVGDVVILYTEEGYYSPEVDDYDVATVSQIITTGEDKDVKVLVHRPNMIQYLVPGYWKLADGIKIGKRGKSLLSYEESVI